MDSFFFPLFCSQLRSVCHILITNPSSSFSSYSFLLCLCASTSVLYVEDWGGGSGALMIPVHARLLDGALGDEILSWHKSRGFFSLPISRLFISEGEYAYIKLAAIQLWMSLLNDCCVFPVSTFSSSDWSRCRWTDRFVRRGTRQQPPKIEMSHCRLPEESTRKILFPYFLVNANPLKKITRLLPSVFVLWSPL